MKVAILGGTRFIGFHLARTLAADASYRVTLFNRGRTRPPGPLPSSVTLVAGDRNDAQHAARLLEEPYDAVCDLSGYSPLHIMPFLTTSHRSRIGHYVFCSTSSVYQVPPPHPYTESAARTRRVSTYGGDKAAVEDLLLKHWRDQGWAVTILRPQGVFGAFEAKHAEFVFSRLHHSLPIFRDVRNTARLTFLFVDDLISAFVKAINTGTSHGKTYNVAGDESINQEDFVTICGEVSSCRTDMRTVADWRHRYVQIGIPWLDYDLVADNSRIKRELGVIFTPLRQALSSTLAWLQANPDSLTPRLLPAESYLAQNRRVPIGRFAAARIRGALASRLLRR